ncbi:hypothetical protein ACIGW4_32975 [Streptomyces sp. NPDC053513]|uniref:hypothetical protein n=1 Tax=unclassified Streptomyces TaxID=2593676 RepID=UPI0037D07DD4
MSVGFRPTEDDTEIIEALKRPGEKTSDVLRRAIRALEREEWQRQAHADMERIVASGENLADEPDEWGYDETGHPVDLRNDPAEEPRRVDVLAEVETELAHRGVPWQRPQAGGLRGQRRLLAAALAASRRRSSSSSLYVGKAARHAADARARLLGQATFMESCLDTWLMPSTPRPLPWGTIGPAHLERHHDRRFRDLLWVVVNQDQLTKGQQKILDELAESLRGDEAANA